MTEPVANGPSAVTPSLASVPWQASKILAHRRTNSGTSLNVDFKARTQRDAEKALAVELDKLLLTAPAGSIREHYEQEFEIFKRVFQRFLSESGAAIDWDLIRPPPASMVVGYPSAMPTSREDAQSMLKRLAVVKLNGGLGTSMGCSGPKSLISVRNDLTFLDLHVQQIENLNKQYGVNVPLVLMNSFSTDDDTSRILPKYRNVGVTIDCFMQNQHPRIDKETLLPICKSLSGPDASDGAWCPSGHGAIYQSLYNSGMLKSLMDKGIEWIFVANIDNLGATIDLNILNSLFSQQEGQAYPEFVMEVTEKTAADVKGGTLVEYQGRLRLLEIAQVPKDHVDEFKSVSKFKIFNTNNLWINLAAIKRVVEEATLHMDIIVNPKMLDNGINVIQLEQAAGAAIKSFESPLGVVVPRSRFLPVKTSSDLLLVMSNLYNLKSGTLSMSLQRSFPSTPLVKLGVTFDKVKEFWKRFASIPDLMELHHLTVAGDVTFGKGVSLRGTVIIIANHGDRIDIPAGSVLENKIVSGNLRILDH